MTPDISIPDNGNYRTLEVISSDTIDFFFFDTCMLYRYSRMHRVNLDADWDEDEDPNQVLINTLQENEFMSVQTCITKNLVSEIERSASRLRPGYETIEITTSGLSHTFYFADNEVNECKALFNALIQWKHNLKIDASSLP